MTFLSKYWLVPVAVSAVSLVALPALAQSGAQSGSPIVGIAALREWNLVVLGNLKSSSEVEGRTFVGGNLSGNSSNYNIRQTPASSNGTPGLTVVGDVNGGHKISTMVRGPSSAATSTAALTSTARRRR